MRSNKVIEVVTVDAVTPITTIRELASAYKGSVSWETLASSTKSRYDHLMSQLVFSPYGEQHPDTITPRIAEAIYKSLVARGTAPTARKFVNTWSGIYRYGIRMGVIDKNPWRDMAMIPDYTPRKVVWTEEEVQLMIATALEMGHKPVAIAIALMYDTAQRQGDVLRLTYGDLHKDEQGYYIVFKQQKTGTIVKPALSELSLNLLEHVHKEQRDNTEYLVSRYYKRGDFYWTYKQIKKRAGIRKELQLRDLRRTAITEMGGASDDLILAVSGHQNRDMLNIYSQKDRFKALEAQKIRHETRNARLREKSQLAAKPAQANGLPGVSGEEHLQLHKDD